MEDKNLETSRQLLEGLKSSIKEFNRSVCDRLVKNIIEEGIDPLEAANALIEGIAQIGEAFSRGELFLPHLSMAADIMKSELPLLDKEIKKRGERRRIIGTVVIGTVKGDVHDIGKRLVSSLLQAGGFEIIDLGIDVSAKNFLEAIREHYPDILAMSSLLTTTAPEQLRVIEKLKEEGLRERVKVIVGGGAITEAFAQKIGADGYAADAPGGLELVKRLLIKR